MLGNIFEGPHLILILIVIMILFGSKKIPEFMQGLARGIKEFKKATQDIQDDIKDVSEDKNTKL